uniref:Lens intrinsic membrane protein 2.4 n=1 Tax=Cyprinus carpio carpio TaxID=630221 RepID=A0A9J8BVE7_CYPCA
MYSFMGGGLFCAIIGNILIVVSTATGYWMQYCLSGSYAHQGLWRYCMANKCYMQTASIGAPKLYPWSHKMASQITGAVLWFVQAYWNATRAFMILSGMACFAGIMAGSFLCTLFVLLAMAINTGVTLSFLGRRFGDWRFSWSYILGWVAMLMTFFAGIFYMCAHRLYESRRVVGSR